MSAGGKATMLKGQTINPTSFDWQGGALILVHRLVRSCLFPQVARRCPPPLGGHLCEVFHQLITEVRGSAKWTRHALLSKDLPRQVAGVVIEIEQLIILHSKAPAASRATEVVIGVAATRTTLVLKGVFVYERHGEIELFIVVKKRTTM